MTQGDSELLPYWKTDMTPRRSEGPLEEVGRQVYALENLAWGCHIVTGLCNMTRDRK